MKFLPQPNDILMDLARCRERDLVLLIVGGRLVYVLYTLLCRSVLPRLFCLPPEFLVFDTGEWLYDDTRFTGVRNWDSVHFFHIAKHGYSHENVHVFFPLVPLLIRVVSFITKDALPVLHRLAPVSLYMCLLNIAATAFAGVVLRRLTLLTLLGPEAHDLVVHHNHYAHDKQAKKRSGGVGRFKSACEAQLEAAVVYRMERNVVGTMIDSFPSLSFTLDTNREREGARVPRSTASLVSMAWRVTGAALLCWIVTPSMVFTVAVYTESCFSFFTFAGVYFLARYPAAVDAADGRCCTFPFPRQRGERRAAAQREQSRGGGNEEGPAAQAVPLIHWQQAYTSRDEVVAVLCFTVAALSRSNAFLCSAFLLYPTFIRACLPSLYQRRWSCIHGCFRAAPPPSQKNRSGSHGSCEEGTKQQGPRIVRTLHPPHGRLTNPLRLLVLFLEVVVVLTPYLAMNYRGWKVFVPMWSPEEQRAIGNKFWKFYGMLQRKYWDVGFFTAYTIVNSPNVIISAPIGFIVVYGSYHFYVKPLLAQRGQLSRKLDDSTTAAPRAEATNSPSFIYVVASFAVSANVVYLWVLGVIAFTLMHVQVANRFLMASPALYWLCGFQLTLKPRSVVTHCILLFSVVWALVGGMMFSNHLPWT